MKDLTDSVSLNAFRAKFEAGRSFDLEDDMEFCPGLLTESDVSARITSPFFFPFPAKTHHNWLTATPHED
jgi:hypothetical protein